MKLFFRRKEKIFRNSGRVILCLIALFPLKMTAQNYFFDSYGVAEGLSQSTVFDIIQDKNDYIWLGTRAGVSRFDGKSFVNYTMQDGLTENGVKVLFIDENENIWMGHYGGGVSIYNGEGFRIFSEAGQAFDGDITSINSDSHGNIWITSEKNGAVKVNRVGSDLEHSEVRHFIGKNLSDRIFGSCAGSDENLYFITDAFVKVYEPQINGFKGFTLEGMPTFFQITSMLEDSRSNLWFGTYNGGLYKYISALDSFIVYDYKRDGLASNWISTLSEDHKGNIWVGTWGGGITRISGNELRTFDHSNGLPDEKIRSIAEDTEGNILIGTEEHGIVIFKGERFINWDERNGLMNSQVWTLEQDRKGQLWIGTNKGINIYHPGEGKKVSSFYKLKDNKIRSIKEDSRGRMWISAENQGVFTWDPSSQSFTYEPGLNTYISSLNASANATALECDGRGLVWAGTNDGLVSYDLDSRTPGYYTQSSGLAANDIKSLYYSPDERLWIGSRGAGLTYMQADTFIRLNLKEEFTATCMVYDENGKLWAGTEARGVIVIDPEKEKILLNLKESDGLLANLINLIEVGDDGRIYIGTNKGLNIYDPLQDKIFSYGSKSGFVGIETKPDAVLKDSEKNLWFGTVAGLTMFNPKVRLKKNENPLTHITSFRVNLQEQKMVQGMKFNHKENDVIFEYISICLADPDAVKYQIMLEGADNDWRPVTEQTMVTYPALAPKKYTFKVRARNSEGYWNAEPVSLAFQIMPPFYQTYWFILLSVFTAMGGVVVYIKVRESNLVREKRILEEKVNERTIEVVAQKEQLAQKNKDITDSIKYARRLQLATLPPEIPFSNTFVLFKPKDIVSGDFYWFELIGDLEFSAAVDCTGHGVPGAFMSIIGANSLNKIVKENNIHEPASILRHLNDEVIRNLKSSDEESAVYDGMDIALTVYNRKTGEMQYAGAYNPLIIIRKNELTEYKADRHSIGRSTRIDHEKKFTNYTIQIEEGDAIYIFSDGYADQFGGEEGKKFKMRSLKDLLISIYRKPLGEQRKILDDTIKGWMRASASEQVDDILVIGRRF